jgi:hypothetical protein
LKRPSIFKIILFNLQSIRGWRPIFVIGLLLVFMGWRRAADEAASIKSLGDFYFLVFSGPGNETSPMNEFLLWFVLQMLFFYLIGDMGYGELSQKCCFLFPALDSRRRWWTGKILTLFILTVCYVLFLVLVLTLGAVFAIPININSLVTPVGLLDLFPSSQPLTGEQLLLTILMLYISSLFALGSLELALSLFFKKSIDSFLFTLSLVLISYFMGVGRSTLIRWLPGAQSMLIQHTFIDVVVPGFSLTWSVVYNALLAAISIGYGYLILKKLDITQSLSRE